MKKTFFILILSLLPIVVFAFEQSIQFPQMQFQSTSSYKSVTGYTPQITEVGATNVYNTQQTTPNRNHIRRVVTDPNEPYITPVGDAPIALMLGLGVLYVLVMRKKERVED